VARGYPVNPAPKGCGTSVLSINKEKAMSYQIVVSGHVDDAATEATVIAAAEAFAKGLTGVSTATASAQYAGTVDLLAPVAPPAPAPPVEDAAQVAADTAEETADQADAAAAAAQAATEAPAEEAAEAPAAEASEPLPPPTIVS
jgi:hypothetical protein